jgi:hypothetical protein
MLNRALLERYQCPQSLAEFTVNGVLSPDAGFFRFGPDTICYGRSAAGSRSQELTDSLYDTGACASVSNASVGLPFDPVEIIDNLRLERYAIDHNLNGTQPLSRKALRFAYYSLRPFFSVPVRRQIQKVYLRGWDNRPFPHWPVDTTVEDLLERCLTLGMQAHGLSEIPFIWFWPDGASACALMTHDVETTLGRDFCSTLMDINDEFQIKASFQVVPEKRYTVTEPYLSSLRDRGFEIGVQDLNHDGHLYSTREEFVRRAALIREYSEQYEGCRAGRRNRQPAESADAGDEQASAAHLRQADGVLPDPDAGQRRDRGDSAGDRRKERRRFPALLGNGRDFGLKHLNYTYQEGEGGIAEALGLAEYLPVASRSA